MDIEELSLNDFSLGLMAALHIKGVNELSSFREANLHASFRKAFEVVKERLGDDKLKFAIITNRVSGISGDVRSILDYWEGTWAATDSQERTWRFRMSNWAASEYLKKLPGGKKVYLEAADAFLKQYNTY
jgi:thymidylate synthase